MASESTATGRLFDIQRYSVNDGPGIRTTVFFKGCSLRCSWCHNPEAISHKKQMMDNKGLSKEIGYDMDVNDLMKHLLKDKPLYMKSGGGVTFSGGEPMLQSLFIAELLPHLKAENIHTAIDTAGNVPFSCYESIYNDVDLFLFDLKILDPEQHRLHAGASNKRVLSNFERLIRNQKQIELRLPIIKGINDSMNDINHMVTYLSSLPQLSSIRRVKVLPYHAMGSFKYGQLGLPTTAFEAPDDHVISLYQEKISQLLPNAIQHDEYKPQ